MKKYLVFVKAETTGLPNFGAPSGDESQPHIVQFAAIKVDPETRLPIASINAIIKPDGWDIPPEASNIHGITVNHAMMHGVSESEVIAEFAVMIAMGEEIICHSSAFIGKILRTAAKRYLGDQIADEWKERGLTCTAKLTKEIVRIPAAKTGYKLPTLEQAYSHFTGKELIAKNNAMICADAIREVYFAYQDLLK
jgi:DNA polymerase-3 subunit epsilon